MNLAVIVEEELKAHPEARNSDKELILLVLERYGLYLSKQQKEIFKSVSTESVRRIRQKLQEQGKYRASEPVQQTRRIKSYVVQQNTPTASTNRLNTLFDTTDYNIKPRRVI